MAAESIHVDTHYRDDGKMAFVEAYDFDQKIPNWRKVPWQEVDGRRVIRCSRCSSPAVVVDCHWPYMSDGCRCARHGDFKAFPLDE